MTQTRSKTPRVCLECGDLFYPWRPTSLYCSDKCSRMPKPGSPLRAPDMGMTKECPGCGEDFVISKGNKKYCSIECRDIAKAVTNRDADGNKRCATCEQWKPLTEFTKYSSAPDGLQGHCRRCHRSAHLLRKYGITADQFDIMLAEQEYKCMICLKSWEEGDASFSVDHDHLCCPTQVTCGDCIRGILCTFCNNFLGKLESKKFLSPYVDYISLKGGESHLKFNS